MPEEKTECRIGPIENPRKGRIKGAIDIEYMKKINPNTVIPDKPITILDMSLTEVDPDGDD